MSLYSWFTRSSASSDPAPVGWTPVLTDRSFDPNKGQTYLFQEGVYLKDGRLVHFWGRLQVTGLGGLKLSDTAHIIGLPNTPSFSGVREYPVVIGSFNAFTPLTGTPRARLYYTLGSRIQLRHDNNNFSSTDVLTIGEFSANGSISFSGSYVV